MWLIDKGEILHKGILLFVTYIIYLECTHFCVMFILYEAL